MRIEMKLETTTTTKIKSNDLAKTILYTMPGGKSHQPTHIQITLQLLVNKTIIIVQLTNVFAHKMAIYMFSVYRNIVCRYHGQKRANSFESSQIQTRMSLQMKI